MTFENVFIEPEAVQLIEPARIYASPTPTPAPENTPAPEATPPPAAVEPEYHRGEEQDEPSAPQQQAQPSPTPLPEATAQPTGVTGQAAAVEEKELAPPVGEAEITVQADIAKADEVSVSDEKPADGYEALDAYEAYNAADDGTEPEPLANEPVDGNEAEHTQRLEVEAEEGVTVIMRFHQGVPVEITRPGEEPGELILQADGIYFEFCSNGVPLGAWWFNDQTGTWEFEAAAGTMPQTGEILLSLRLALLGIILLISGLLIKRRPVRR
jgi:hypothetical protein